MAQNRVPRAVEKGCCEERGEFFGGLIRPNEVPKTAGEGAGHKNSPSNGLCGGLGGVCEGVFVVIVQWVCCGCLYVRACFCAGGSSEREKRNESG